MIGVGSGHDTRRFSALRPPRHGPREARGDGAPNATYEDTPGFRRGATTGEIRQHGRVLTPGRHVGYPEPEEDDEPFPTKFARLRSEMEAEFAESERVTVMMHDSLRRIQQDPGSVGP